MFKIKEKWFQLGLMLMHASMIFVSAYQELYWWLSFFVLFFATHSFWFWQEIKKERKQKNVYFVGVRGAGKDYRATQLQQQGYVKLSFADPVREITYMIVGLAEPVSPELYEDLKKNYEVVLRKKGSKKPLSVVSFRNLLINVGDGLREKVDPFIWIKLLSKKEKELNDLEILTTVSDFRYPNEGLHGKRNKKFIFCNYKSDRYEIGDGDSEWMANRLLQLGYEDGEEIPYQIIKDLQEEFTEMKIQRIFNEAGKKK